MTATAASLIQRPRHVREPVPVTAELARPSQPAARKASVDSSFAAHLEQRTPSQLAELPSAQPIPANDVRTAISAPVNAVTADPVPQAEPATGATKGAATGNALPDNRQFPAHAAARAIQTLLGARTAAKGDAAPADAETLDAAPPKAEPEPAPAIVTAATPLLLALPAPLSLPSTPQAAAQPPQTAAAARIGAPPQRSAERPGATSTAPISPIAEANPAAPGPAASAALAAPTVQALSFVLERDTAAPGLPDPAPADAQAAPSQNAPCAEPSTLAALTGATTPTRPASRKVRADNDAALTGAKLPSDNAVASPVPSPHSAQPASGAGQDDPVSALAATAMHPEGIGFDKLVDSIARARDYAAGGAADGSPVAVAMRHAEFGRVSIRFHSDADGLSVAMTSPDPGFAPAVAAAHSAQAAEATASTEAAPRSPQTSDTIGPGSDGSQMRGGTGQRQDSPPQPRGAAEPSRTPQRGSAPPSDDGRGGIFA